MSKYIGINRGHDGQRNRSDVEWAKHLSSDGFVFPASRAEGDYTIGFVAAPDHPSVEYDIRRFLNEIEAEFEGCRFLRSLCSPRWQCFPLPERIDRSNITSRGYDYGEYRFSLDQEHILQLLMGENLYEHPYIFVRELVQNAIDATRLREYFSHQRGEVHFKAAPIEVTTWRDDEGSHWLRIDDNGTGMDESIIKNHLLKVGVSYYGSLRYKVDVARVQKNMARDFMPISRFGIGLLSCFIVADRVEISTRRETPEEGGLASPIRMSLAGLHGFFVLQRPPLAASAMPSALGDTLGYRNSAGTSIAVRIDPARDSGSFRPREILNRMIFCSPVPVKFSGRSVGHGWDTIFAPGATNKWEQHLTADQAQLLRSWFPENQIFPERVLLWAQVIEVGSGPDFQARCLIAGIAGLEESGIPQSGLVFCSDSVKLVARELEYTIYRHGRDDNTYSRSADICVRLPLSRFFNEEVLDSSYNGQVPVLQHHEGGLASHNGIVIPLAQILPHKLDVEGRKSAFTISVVALQDSCRPDLSVGRNEVRAVPWHLCSVADRELFRATHIAQDFFNIPALDHFPVQNIFENDHDLVKDGFWWDKKLFGRDDTVSIKDIVEGGRVVNESLRPTPHRKRYSGFVNRFESGQFRKNALVTQFCDIQLNTSTRKVKLSARKLLSQGTYAGERHFSPLTFVAFDDVRCFAFFVEMYYFSNSRGVAGSHFGPVYNKEHEICRWIVANAPVMARYQPGLLSMLVKLLSQGIECKAEFFEEAFKQWARELNSLIAVAGKRLGVITSLGDHLDIPVRWETICRRSHSSAAMLAFIARSCSD